MKPTRFSILASLALVGPAFAATSISFSYYTATSSTDTSWVSPTGSTSVKAVNFGGGETTFGGVTWLIGNQGSATYNDTPPIPMWLSAPSSAWASNHPDFYNDGTALLEEGAYSNLQSGGGVDFSLDMNGFTVGQEYLIQFVLADSRPDGWAVGRTITIDGYSANIASQDSSAYQYAYGDGRFAVVTARFTPAAGDTAFSFRPLVNGGTTGLQVNGIQVLAIPEPSAAMLGGLGLLALLRRRRA